MQRHMRTMGARARSVGGAAVAVAAGWLGVTGCSPQMIDAVGPHVEDLDASTGSVAPGSLLDPDAGTCHELVSSPPAADAGTTPSFGAIVQAASPPPPISGGTLIVLRGGVMAVAADPDRDLVYVVDLSAPTAPRLRSSTALGPKDRPGRLVEDGDGRVQIILRGSSELATLDPVSGEITARRATCTLPSGLAYDAARDRLHVACGNGQLITFAPGDPLPERTLNLPSDLRDVVVDGDNLLVSRFRSAEMLVIDPQGAVVLTQRPSAFSDVTVRNAEGFTPSVAWRMTKMPGGGAVMIHQRGTTHHIGGSQGGGYAGPMPDVPGGGCNAIVHSTVSKLTPGVLPEPGPVMEQFVLPVDVAVSPDGETLAAVAAGNGHGPSGRRLFVGKMGHMTHRPPAGKGCGSRDVRGPDRERVCAVSFDPAVEPSPVGDCPPATFECAGQCVSPSNRCVPPGTTTVTTPVLNQGTTTTDLGGANFHCAPEIPVAAEAVSVAFLDATHVLVQTREPALLWVVSTETTVGPPPAPLAVTLSTETRADTGHAMFHSNSGGGIACASCHAEGHEDARVWSVGCDGARRTQDISGGLRGTEPFHWSGDIPTFNSLMRTVFVTRMGGPSPTTAQMNALLDWLDSIPTNPPQRLAGDPQVERGRALFESPVILCSTCHSGPMLSNNQTVDVGTGGKFQVPRLAGVGWRAPYTHTGCARTLEERFTSACAGGDRHGRTSVLARSQVDDIVAYLESL